jgi:replication factor C subunit 3/5
VEEEGVEAVCRLGRGGMRQTLNILQSTFMSAGRVSAEAAYLCTGNPQPSQIETMATWLLNEPMDNAYAQLRVMQVRCPLYLRPERPRTVFEASWYRSR